MDVVNIILSIGLIILLIAYVYEKNKDNQSENKNLAETISQNLKNNDDLIKVRLDNIKETFEKSSKNSVEKISDSLEKNESLLKERLANLSEQMKDNVTKPLEKINSVLLNPFQRGKMGNSQLDQLLALYLPKDPQIYQMEFSLKKKAKNDNGLRADAIIFGLNKKNNLAIDSKFPLENYLLMHKNGISEVEKQIAEKNFKTNLENHIKKVAEYVSKEDSIDNVIMFVPSDAIYLAINDLRFYEIIEFALEKKVTICSPMLLAVVVNHIS
jgi:DNA recombination protein RmuC